MKPLTLEEFEAEAQAFDRAVLSTAGIATYCSGSAWILAAHRHLHDGRETFLWRGGEEGEAWLAMASGPLAGRGQLLQPLEAAWCFACPLIGPADGVVGLLLRALAEPVVRGRPVLLGGVPSGSALEVLVRRRAGRSRRVMGFPGVNCLVAELGEGGADAYFAGRSASFRRGVRAAARRAAAAGVTFERVVAGPAPPVFERVLAVEARSWKEAAGESIFRFGSHRRFYADALASSARTGGMRAVFARLDGRDVAYCIGAVLGSTYRGFQLGFDEACRPLSLGNLAQLEMVDLLAAEGCRCYDLGMEIGYKERWATRTLELVNLVLLP